MNILKKNNYEALFYIGYFLLVIFDMYINMPIISKFYTILMGIGLAFIVLFDVLSCKFNDIDRKKILLMIIISVLLAIFYLFSHDITIFKIYALAIALIFIDIDSFLKKDFKFKVISLFLLLTISLIMISSSSAFDRMDGTIRYSLGTQHPNFLSAHVLVIILEMYYLYFSKKFNFLFLVILSIAIIFEHVVPNTRTCVLILIMLFGYYIISNIKIKKIKIDMFKILKKPLCLLPIFLVLLSIILSITVYYDIDILDKINKVLSGRLYLYGYYFDEVHLSLFGKDIVELQKELPLDNAYMYLLLKFGIIQFSIITYFIYRTLKKLIENKQYSLSITIIMLELYAFAETTPLIPTINVFILLISIVFKDMIITNKKMTIKQSVDVKEVQKLQLNMLVKLTKYLDENNISYYLCGGTLLGAIRHKGFIPWDDDIDIFVPRPDYERLINIATDKFITEDIIIKTIKSHDYEFPFIKAYDVNYIVEEEKIKTKEEYLWVDIFPVDGMSEKQEDNKKLMKKIFFYRKLLNAKMYRNNEFKKLFHGKTKICIKMIQKFFVSLVPSKVYSKKIDKISRKYSYENSDYVGGIMWGYGPQERIKKEEFLQKIKVDFEGEKFTTFACWDSYLKNLYGNYMELPPESERKFHLMNFARLEKNEEKIND